MRHRGWPRVTNTVATTGPPTKALGAWRKLGAFVLPPEVRPYRTVSSHDPLVLGQLDCAQCDARSHTRKEMYGLTYSLFEPCRACAKSGSCGDAEKLRDAIYAIHTSGEQHQGGGAIVLACTMIQRVVPGDQPVNQ